MDYRIISLQPVCRANRSLDQTGTEKENVY